MTKETMSGHDHHTEMAHEHMQHEMPHEQHKMTHDHMDHTMSGMAHEEMHHDMSGMDHDHMTHMDHGDMMMHGGHMMHMGNMRLKLLVSVLLTIPIVLLSPMMGMQLPFTVTGIPGQNWLVLLLGTILFFYGGSPFYNGAVGELRAKKPAMMTLITMGITVAYFYSVYATVANAIHPHAMVMDFFWELATLIDIMLLGHIIEMNAVMQAGSAVNALADLLPKQAHKLMADGTTMDVPVTDLQGHDHILVKENERIPVDGTVMGHDATVDESLVTGESTLIAKHDGDAVIGGALNGANPFTLMVNPGAQASFIAQVQHMVAQAQSRKSQAETTADKVAGWLFYAAMIVGILALVIWTAVHGFAFALPIAVTVFIIACPHALGLAVPLVVARLTGLAASEGILIQNREALAKIDDLRYVLMDKTGTLTDGQFKVQMVVPYHAVSTEADVLAVAAGLEQGSSHPIAAGILAYAKAQGVTPIQFDHVQAVAGVGVAGHLHDRRFTLTNVAYVQDQGLDFGETVYSAFTKKGYTVSVLSDDTQVLGVIALGDAIKPDATEFVADLQQRGLMPVMLTGDNVAAAQLVADQLGITEVRAELKPADKLALVEQYQAQGAVMMIGDGVNDSPALAQADLGVAIGAGTDVAINAADVVLVHSQPSDVLTLMQLAHDANRKMTQNLWWGAGYNLVAIPLAAGILIPVGFKLDPMVGAIVMSLSTVIVAVNALLLKLRA